MDRDAELMRLVADGDQAAFRAIVERYQTSIGQEVGQISGTPSLSLSTLSRLQASRNSVQVFGKSAMPALSNMSWL